MCNNLATQKGPFYVSTDMIANPKLEQVFIGICRWDITKVPTRVRCSKLHLSGAWIAIIANFRSNYGPNGAKVPKRP